MSNLKLRGRKLVCSPASLYHTKPRGIPLQQLEDHLQHDLMKLMERKQYFITTKPEKAGDALPELRAFDAVVKAIALKLCEAHPEISIDPDMLGGMPHVGGLRLAVGDILAKLHRFGNIERIVETYKPDLTEQHVKEAIAYAQDFLEEVYVHGESSEADD